MYKSRLHEYTQKSSIPLPSYQTDNEGSQHQPQFRSIVSVGGACYKSPNTFSQRRAAEMDVSKIAFLDIMQKQKEEGASFIQESTLYSKSILVEYANRLFLEKPRYQTTQTTQPDPSFPLFSSTLVFNGVTYAEKNSRTKLDAERLAAHEAVLSILDSEAGNCMAEIINSKFKDIKSKVSEAEGKSEAPQWENACQICNVQCTSRTVYHAHVASQKHKKKCKPLV